MNNKGDGHDEWTFAINILPELTPFIGMNGIRCQRIIYKKKPDVDHCSFRNA